ncbi:MAG: nuclear transport factor 2 family protein [Candidatus Kapabacteria bacterium]|nr:nuclear transport factor 2 family protein [Candidatus Kapabacteria bacterium]
MLKYLLFISISFILVYSCGPRPDELTTAEMAKEKEDIIATIKAFNKAMEEERFEGLVPYLSEDVIFFGTDSSEIIKSLSDFKKAITEQFNAVESLSYGEMSDISIQMDSRGTFASIIYGVPTTYKMVGSNAPESYFFRVNRTLKKEGGKWVIVSGIVSIARTGKPIQPEP